MLAEGICEAEEPVERRCRLQPLLKVYVDTFADVGRLAEGVDADALFDPFLVDEFGNLAD